MEHNKALIDLRGLLESMQHELDSLINAPSGEVSDGYHTFNELYDYRMVYNALLFNEWAMKKQFSVHKSYCHYDGEPCFDGKMFIVVAQLPTGQISNHYHVKYWDYFMIPERKRAAKWDNHNPVEALQRMKDLLPRI